MIKKDSILSPQVPRPQETVNSFRQDGQFLYPVLATVLVEFVQKLATLNTGHPGHGCRQETRDQGPIWAVALLRGLSSDDLPWI